MAVAEAAVAAVAQVGKHLGAEAVEDAAPGRAGRRPHGRHHHHQHERAVALHACCGVSLSLSGWHSVHALGGGCRSGARLVVRQALVGLGPLLSVRLGSELGSLRG